MTGSREEIARKGRNVGTNQAVSELTVRSACDRYGPNAVINISPRQKGAKWPESTFQVCAKQDRVSLVGYTGNQDQRDAFKLATIAATQRRFQTPKYTHG